MVLRLSMGDVGLDTLCLKSKFSGLLYPPKDTTHNQVSGWSRDRHGENTSYLMHDLRFIG